MQLIEKFSFNKKHFFRFLDRARKFLPLKRRSKQKKKPPSPPSPTELREMIEQYKVTLKANPEDCSTNYKLGQAYWLLHRFREAIPPLQEAIRIDTNFVEAYHKLGRVYLDLGREEEAVKHLHESLIRHPSSLLLKKLLAKAHTSLCVTYGKLGRHAEAVKEFHKAIKIQPNFGEAYLAIGFSYVQLGRYQDALDKFEEAMRLDKNLSVEVHYNLGIVFGKLGDHKKALKHYKEATKINPKSALPQLNMGNLYMKLGQYKEAVEPLSKAVKYSPRLASEGFFQLGLALNKLERFEEAVEPLQKALAISPKNKKVNDQLVEALYQTSCVYAKTHRRKEERERLREVVRLKPTHALAYFNLGIASDHNRDGKNAVTYTHIAKELFAENRDSKRMSVADKNLAVFLKKYKMKPEALTDVKIPGKFSGSLKKS